MREVPDAFGEHAEQRDVRLESTLRVVGMEVLTDGDAAHRRVAVAELGEATLGVEAS